MCGLPAAAFSHPVAIFEKHERHAVPAHLACWTVVEDSCASSSRASWLTTRTKRSGFTQRSWGSGRNTTFRLVGHRWITVTSPEGPDHLELALEPNANPAGRTFQEAMFSQGIPVAAFEVTDIAGEFARDAKGCRVHAAADRRRTGDDRRVRGHLRQSDPAVPAELIRNPGPSISEPLQLELLDQVRSGDARRLPCEGSCR